MLLILRSLLIASVVFANSMSLAEETVRGIPNFHNDYPSTSLHQYILGSTCLSLPPSRLELACNPAFLANEDKRQARLDIASNDHIKHVNDYRIKLESKDSTGIVNKILSQREAVVARATSAAWYQHDWWAVGYVPFRGGFAHVTRNPAYPEVSAHVYRESEVFAKSGFLVSGDKHLQVGFQLRYVERDFFRREFDLLDALGDPSQVRVENQQSLFLEPGVNYSFDSDWSSALSMTVTQMRVAQNGYQSPFRPVLDFGFRTAPPILGKRLTTTTHFTSRPDRTDILSRFMWGALYEFNDLAALSLSLGKSDFGVGANGHYDSVVFGLGWKMEEIAPDEWNSQRVSTVLFEVGLVF